jgi:hypothetical protein
MKIKTRYQQGMALLAAYSLSTYAHAATSLSFLDKLEKLICSLIGTNGKLVGIVVVLAIVMFGVTITLLEDKGSAVTTGLKIGFGISILVGAISLAAWFGVGISCSGTSSAAVNIQL